MQSLSYVLFLGSLGVAAGYIFLKAYWAIINGHGIDAIFYSLPLG